MIRDVFYMPRRIIDHHASIVIVKADNLFFFNGYDLGYPRPEWVGCLSPLGGNYEKGDVSPLALLQREIIEEMTDEEKKFGNFDSAGAEVLKENILKNIQPYQDFVIVDPVIEKTKNFTREQRSAIISFYEAVVPKSLLEATRRLLGKEGKRVISEGDGGSVVDIDYLLSGKRYLAWSNPFMMSHYLGKMVPCSREGEAEPIGLPRESLEKYLSDFEYIKF